MEVFLQSEGSIDGKDVCLLQSRGMSQERDTLREEDPRNVKKCVILWGKRPKKKGSMLWGLYFEDSPPSPVQDKSTHF